VVEGRRGAKNRPEPRPEMKIGVVSDTHGYFDSRLQQVFAGVELILHAGDVGSQEILDQLAVVAPVRAVRGNIDPPELNLPPSLKLAYDRLQIEMLHVLPVPQSKVEEWAGLSLSGGKPPLRQEAFSKSFAESTRVVVFGHSHVPCLVALRHRLFFNPGSAGRRRFSLPRCCGLLELVPRGIRASIELLEKYNGVVAPGIQMDFEE
jgi:putative phosphoesterase